MTCCFLLVLEKVFPSKSSLSPEMHHVWENLLNRALMVRDEAAFGFRRHVNSSVSTDCYFHLCSDWSGSQVMFLFSLSLWLLDICWKRVLWSEPPFITHSKQPLISSPTTSAIMWALWPRDFTENSITCHKVFQGPGMTLTHDKGRVWIPFFSVT